MDLKISVIIPCYNQSHFLNDAVGSVIRQTYTNWECIIVNDGSADNTDAVAKEWCLKDARIKYVKKENGGLSSARNKGLEEARCDYIQFLDADDVLDVNKFSESIHASQSADVIITNFNVFNNNTGSAGSPSFDLNKNQFNFLSVLTDWDEKFVIPIHCGLFKSHLFTNVRFNENLKAREDWVMWLQIFKQNIKTVFINEPLALYRQSGNSMSQNKEVMDKNLIEAYKVIYPILPENYREKFFEKAMTTISNLLAESSVLIKKTRESKSYRLGNYFVRNFNKVVKLFN